MQQQKKKEEHKMREGRQENQTKKGRMVLASIQFIVFGMGFRPGLLLTRDGENYFICYSDKTETDRPRMRADFI